MFLKHWFFSILILGLICKTDASRQDDNIPSLEEVNQIIIKAHRNITLPCWPHEFPNKTASVYWEKSGTRGRGETVLSDGSLFISDLSKSDTKRYMCRMSENDLILTKVHLYVTGPPSGPVNVTVNARSQDAVVTWHQPLDLAWQAEMGGVPTFGEVRYALSHTSSWKQIEKLITIPQVEVRVPGLKPNSTYEFQVWATNMYGDGKRVSTMIVTLADTHDIEMSLRVLQSSSETIPRVWLTAAVVLLLVVNALGTVVLFIYARRNSRALRPRSEDSEQIELVPNIIENPAYSSDPVWRRTLETGSNGFESLPTRALISRTEFV